MTNALNKTIEKYIELEIKKILYHGNYSDDNGLGITIG